MAKRALPAGLISRNPSSEAPNPVLTGSNLSDHLSANDATSDSMNGGNGPRTLTEAAYERLREDIIEGHLPPGEKLRIEALKSRYGVGAATLREAITRLQSDALVVAEGQRGFWVASISMSDLEDLTRLRTHIEIEALKQSINKNLPWWRSSLQQAFDALTAADEQRLIKSNWREWEVLNARFHQALIAGAESPWTDRILKMLSRQSERYRRLSLVIKHNQAAQRNVHEEHALIFEAAMAGRVARAALALEVHIAATPDLILRAHAQTPET